MILKTVFWALIVASILPSCDNGNKSQQSVAADSLQSHTVNQVQTPPTYEVLANNGVFRIEGQLQNGAGKQVFIQELPLQQPGKQPQVVLLDTSIVKPDGTFVLEGTVNQKQLGIIGTDQQHLMYTLIDGGNFTFSGDYNSFGQARMNGSREVGITQSFFNNLNQYFSALNTANSNLRQAEQNKSPAAEVDSKRLLSHQAIDTYYGFLKEFMDTSYSKVTSLFAATILDIGVDFEFMKDFYNRTAPLLPNHKYILDLSNKIARYSHMINTPAPDISLPNPEGDTITLSSLRGQVVLLDFWAAWCMPCRRENPNVVRVYERFKDDGFTVYSVSLDKTKSQWVQAIAKDNLTWENHVSELAFWQTKALQPYGVNSIPAAFLIDREGNIVAKNLRGYSLERKVAQLVAQ